MKPTYNPHLSSWALRASFSLSFIKTLKKKWKQKQTTKIAGLLSNQSCFELRVYTLQEALSSSRDSGLFSRKVLWILTVLWGRTANKNHSLLISPISHVEKKKYYMVVADILSFPNEIFPMVSHKTLISLKRERSLIRKAQIFSELIK